MPDSSDIDTAIVNKLLADPTLKALMPDGVFMDLAGASLATGKNSTRFVIVSVISGRDEAVFGGRGFENLLYLVKAVAIQGAGDVKGAAARIDQLLEDSPIVAAGYTCMAAYREERIRTLERDEIDASIVWQHRGGWYRVQMTATAPPAALTARGTT